jgi:Glycosyltransferase family 87
LAGSDIALAALLLGVLALTGFAWAAALRLPLTSTLLAAYVAIVAETTLLTTALSPMRYVTRTGFAVGESLVLLAALAVWQRRGRPLPKVAIGRALRAALEGSPATVILFVVVVAALSYELVLGLTVPPNNWDSLTYHLTRAAAWFQHRGVYWIPNAPTDRINEFQPLAEQQILFLFVVTGKGALYALPQYLGELAIVTAIYTSGRRLGLELRQSFCAALFFASLPLVALEATTAQNDLVAASLVAVAGSFLLGRREAEFVLAGVAVALGLGVKLTTVLVLPVLVLLVVARGRRAISRFAVAGIITFVLVGMWGYVLNVVHTGHILGHGGGRVEQQASPSFVGSPTTAFRILYKLLDLSGLSGRLLFVFVVLGIVFGLSTLRTERRLGRSPRRAGVAAAAVALPLVVPRLVPDVAHALHIVATAVSLPVQAAASTGGEFFWGVSYGANEDLSSFGPLGGPALLLVSLVALVAAARRGPAGIVRAFRLGAPAIALALALPLVVVLLALTSKFNPWLARFLLVPVALAAPLLAPLFRRREVALAVTLVAAGGLFGVEVHNQLKPLHSQYGFAWQLSQADAAALTWQPGAGPAITAFDRLVPERGCLGAVLDSDEAAYPLFGPHLGRKVEFLPRTGAVSAAARTGLTVVLIGHVPHLAGSFAKAGWRLRGLPASPARRYWTLATRPGVSASCVPRI